MRPYCVLDTLCALSPTCLTRWGNWCLQMRKPRHRCTRSHDKSVGALQRRTPHLGSPCSLQAEEEEDLRWACEMWEDWWVGGMCHTHRAHGA